MKIEIETASDYLQAKALLRWMELAEGSQPLPPDALDLISELTFVVDDYRQLHYPIGGDPEA